VTENTYTRHGSHERDSLIQELHADAKYWSGVAHSQMLDMAERRIAMEAALRAKSNAEAMCFVWGFVGVPAGMALLAVLQRALT
jgi:hypothetical protein